MIYANLCTDKKNIKIQDKSFADIKKGITFAPQNTKDCSLIFAWADTRVDKWG